MTMHALDMLMVTAKDTHCKVLRECPSLVQTILELGHELQWLCPPRVE